MRILYIGTPQNHELYLKGHNPSHWMYGVEEMAKDGHDVIFESETSGKFDDLKLIGKYKPDMIYIPNMNLHTHVVTLVMRSSGLLRTPIYGVLHHAPRQKGLKKLLYKLMFGGIDCLFTLSDLTRKITIEGGYMKPENMIRLDWGPDMDFYKLYNDKVTDEGFFISTGKECRDFDLLIEAFKIAGAPLKIMTAKSHGSYNYEYLEEKCKDIPNIEVVIQENTGAVYPGMCEQMNKALALVCPLKLKDITYNVGLSTVLDAEGLGKQMIITKNPFHSAERIAPFYAVETVDEWVKAIKEVQKRNRPAIKPFYTMDHCYEQMREFINRIG